jgi:hypothetical protein
MIAVLYPVILELGSRALITRAYDAPIYLLRFVAVEEARGRFMSWLSDGQNCGSSLKEYLILLLDG